MRAFSGSGSSRKGKADEATPLAAPPAEEVPPVQRHRIGTTSVMGATAILATFSTTSSNVMYPRAYGVLGSLFGPLFGVVLQGFMCLLAVLTVRIAVRLQCRTFGELGYALGGSRGKWLLGGVQQLNNALFMPVALVFAANALRQVVLFVRGCNAPDNVGLLDFGSCAWWSCNINSLWVIALFAWPVLLLARDVGDLSWNAYVSLILIVVQTAAIFSNVTSDVGPRGNASAVPQPLALIGSTTLTAWNAVVSAYGIFLYSFCPLFIAVEISATMRNPEQISLAIALSFAINLCVYLPTGLVVDHHWGAGMPTPITEVLVGAYGAIANAILFYCTFLDFAIVGAVLNRELQAYWMPTFDRMCSVGNLPTWLLLTLPSLVFALGLSILTPRLDSLAGFLESLCVPVTMLAGVPAMLLVLRSRRESLGLDKSASSQLVALEMAKGWEPALVMGVVIGLVFFTTIAAETCYSIFVETDYAGRPSSIPGYSSFFCDVVAR